MSHVDIIHARKDEEYRPSLSDAECALLPDKPAGLIELTEAELGAVAGAALGIGQAVQNATDATSVVEVASDAWFIARHLYNF